MRVIWSLLLTIAVSTPAAATPTFSSLLECEQQPRQCIVFTEKALTSAKVLSVRWYHLKNLNLSARWQLTDTDPIREELETLAALDDAPAVFRITVLTIYSKLLISEGKTELGKQLVDEVVDLIRQVNAVSLSPDRYAELIVLLNAIGDLAQADVVGKRLLNALQQTRRSIELGDFYGALGHTQFRLERYEAAISYYQLALESFTQMQHVLEVTGALHNIARSYQAMQQHENAIVYFQKSIQWRAKAGSDPDPINEQYSRIRYVESLFHAGQRERAREEFAQIRMDHVLGSYMALYQKTADLIGWDKGAPTRR